MKLKFSMVILSFKLFLSCRASTMFFGMVITLYGSFIRFNRILATKLILFILHHNDVLVTEFKSVVFV